MPSEGRLVYVAGHRTTYAASFADIDKMRAGDEVARPARIEPRSGPPIALSA